MEEILAFQIENGTSLKGDGGIREEEREGIPQ